MILPEEGRSAGAHRRASGNRLVGLVVSLTLVVIAAAGVFVTLHWRGEGKRPPAIAATTPSHHPTASHSSAPASHSSSLAAASSPATLGSSAAASAPAPAASSAAPTSAAPSAATSSAATTTPPAPAVKIPVDVLNDTHISGLAARAAQTLTSGGWTVTSTGNYPHTVPQTTVYYQPGQQGSAQLLATQFPKIRRVLAAPAGLVADHLTLVLAQDWT